MQQILNWAEVWATLIPIITWLIIKANSESAIYKPLFYFFLISLTLYVLIDLAYFKILKTNNFIYTLISLNRLLFFVNFFFYLNIFDAKKTKGLLLAIMSLIVILSIINNPIAKFNSILFSIESVIFIMFSIKYYFKIIHSDIASKNSNEVLLIVTGLAIYESACFPIFLAYNTLIDLNRSYATNIWNVHNIAYIIFCLFIARAFYGNTKR